MKSNFQRTADWLFACGKHPGKATLSLQIGCDIEEAVEFWDAIEVSDADLGEQMKVAMQTLALIGVKLKKGAITASIKPGRRTDALDALCDREVTGNGVAYLSGFDKEEADKTILDSNDAKLVDGRPVILDGGKIGKPQGWKAPDLTRFV